MLNYNVPDSTTYHRQLSLLPKHTHTNRWWGFCLELLTTINYNIYIMQTGSKPGTLQSSSYVRHLPHLPMELEPPHGCRSLTHFILGQGDPILPGSEVISSFKLFIKLGVMRHL